MKQVILRQLGFTLVEFVCVLVILGIISVGLGMGLNSLVDSWVLTRDTAAAVQNIQLAMDRVQSDIGRTSAVDIESVGPSHIKYAPKYFGESEHKKYELKLADGNLIIDGNALLTNVSRFSIEYLDTYDGSPKSQIDEKTKLVHIRLGVSIAGNEQIFNMRVRLKSD